MAARSDTPLAKAVDRRLYIMGMTREELARQMGISLSYLSTMVSGRYKPNIEMSENMAAILEMDGREIRELALKKAI